MPYRGLPTNEPCVVLTMGPSTYWMRLRATFPALSRIAAWYVGLANLVLTGGWLLLSSLGETAGEGMFRLTVTGYLAVGTTLFVLVLFALLALVRSLERPAAERWLPRRMVFTEQTILVTDGEGHESDAGWSTVQEAQVDPTEIRLLLCREPIQRIYLHRRAVGEAQFDLLTRWLKTNTTTT
jgi:hypothetical protein